MKTWNDYVQFREPCDDCGERTMVAVVKRGRLPSVRICRRCFPLGNWRRSTWHDARFHRIRANRLSKQLGVALKERDHARDLACQLQQELSAEYAPDPAVYGAYLVQHGGTATVDGSWAA